MTRLHLAHPDHGPLLCGNPSTDLSVVAPGKATCLHCLRIYAATRQREATAAQERLAALRLERNPAPSSLFSGGEFRYVVTFVNPRPEGAEGVSCP